MRREFKESRLKVTLTSIDFKGRTKIQQKGAQVGRTSYFIASGGRRFRGYDPGG